ncbi:hypothetical protein GCM10023340_38640 [Nocardioides marinquilinus]|uniref:ParB-like N-terminal domain-containing protein n=1 Tax=Nocardioides marinquilinus TaxID=1210400 RepID=A0ABP9PZL4_9ACTN
MTAAIKPLNGFAMVALNDLHPSPENPRERLTDLDGLASSIREVGLIQPIIAQRIPGEAGLRIVAGHRRHAAALKAGMREVPVIVRRDMLPDEELLAMLVENGQRAGLDPIEEARAFRRLKSAGVADSEIARKVGRSPMYVGNRLALLSLPIEEQEQVRAGTTTLAAAVSKARVDAGRVRPTAKGKKSAQHFDLNHDLGTRARARCQQLGHRAKGAASVGGIACGECWESVIRADERQHLHDQSEQRGRCVLCDTSRPTSAPDDTIERTAS